MKNPLIYVDPSGHIFDVIFDVESLVYDAYESIKDTSWENAGYIGLDAAAAIIPFVPSGSAPLRTLSKTDDVSDAVSSVAKGTRGNNITPHHMPSVKYMETNAGVTKNDGVSMNMEQPSPGMGGDIAKLILMD